MCKYMYRGLFAFALAFYGCIGSNSIMSRGMQSRDAIDGDGVPITMDTTLDYIDMSATTVKDLKEFIVPGYEDKVTAPQVENIITNSIRLSTVTETVGNWTWVDGEYKEADDDIKTFGLWYKDGKWHAYVTDILTPKVGQKSIFQTASVEGSESDTSVTMNFSELGLNFTFNRNGDKVLTAYEVEVYTAECDEYTGATKTEKTKLEVEGLKMYKSEPFMAVGYVTNCHYLVVNESDKGNITRFGNAQAALDAEEILIKSERDSETGKLIGYFVRFKKKDVLGLVYKPDLEGFVTESDLLSFYYPDGNVTNMNQITTNGIEYAVGNDGSAYVVKGEELSGNVVLPWKVTIDGNEYKVTAIGESGFDTDYYYNSFTSFTAPITLKVISKNAFAYCDSLKSVNIPSATSIGDRAFNGCYSLKSVNLPSVINIESGGFYYCGSLESVNLPSVTSIGRDGFVGCRSLTVIDFGSSPKSAVPSVYANAFNNVPTSCRFIIPLGMSDEWIAAEGWKELYAQGYKLEGYASTDDVNFKVAGLRSEVQDNYASNDTMRMFREDVEGKIERKRDVSDNQARNSSYGGWEKCATWVDPSGTQGFHMLDEGDGNWDIRWDDWDTAAEDWVPNIGNVVYIPEGQTIFRMSEVIPAWTNQWFERKEIAKSGESYVTPTYVQTKLGDYASVKEVSSLSESMQGKRDLTNNVAAADSVQFSQWKFHCEVPEIQAALNANPPVLSHNPNVGPTGGQWTANDGPKISGFEGSSGWADGAVTAESIIIYDMYMDLNTGLSISPITATRERIVISKSGESYVTTTFVTNSIAPYEAIKRKLDQIAALEPPSSTVRDLITWANAVQSILKGDLMGGDSSISPAAVLSSSNKYYWDEQTETCYRMTVENDYTIMRAVTNVPPTVEVVLALEKELNKETNK